MQYLDRIKYFSLKEKLVNYKDYINYFHSLNLVEQTKIIEIMINYKKYNPINIKNGNLDKLYNAYQILLHKLKYNELNIKERNIYENITAYLIIKEEFKLDELFTKYCNKYLNSINRDNYNRKIFLILEDVLNNLNEQYNKKTTLSFDDFVDYAAVDFSSDTGFNDIYLNDEIFKNYYYDELKKETDIIKETAYLIFVIHHEYRHIIQKENIYNNLNELSNLYKDEMNITQTFNSFYNKYHDNFYVEIEANNVGLMNTLIEIKKYFQNSKIITTDLIKYINNESIFKRKNNKEFLIFFKFYLILFKAMEKLENTIKKFKTKENLYELKKKH